MSQALKTVQLSNLTKFTGTTLSVIGKIMDRIGTATLWFTLLTYDIEPGEVTDERIEEATIRAFVHTVNEIDMYGE